MAAVLRGDASACSFLHRDVKPDNLFVFPGGLVKVGDFGEAKQQAAMSLTHSSKGSSGLRVRGTSDFVSPEMWRREADDATDVDRAAADSPATDVYSFGMTMVCLLHLSEPQPWTRRLEATPGLGRLSAEQREAAVRSKVLKGERPVLSEDLSVAELGEGLRCVDAGVVGEWTSLMERCWAHDPSSRPSALEVAMELQRLVDVCAKQTIVN